MEGMPERAYADYAGLSRGAVQKARKTGRLVLFADGSIDAAASDARLSGMTDPDHQMRARGAYPASAEEEGDRVTLAEARTTTFAHRRKVFMVSRR